MRTVLIAAALLGLAACGREGPAAPADPAESPPIPSKPPLVRPPDASDRLTLVDGAGAARLHLACRASPPACQIVAPGFEPIGSEDRLTLGAGDEAFAHAADLQASGPGVTAGGAIDADLLARLERGERVRAVYGSQSVGPLAAAAPEGLRAVVERCRLLRGG